MAFQLPFKFSGSSSDALTRGRASPSKMMEYDQPLVWVTLLLLLFGMVMVYSASISLPDSPKYSSYTHTHWLTRQAIFICVALVVGLFTSSSTVQAGHVGVITTFGSVEPRVLQPGFHLVMPFAQRIVQIDTRVSPHTWRTLAFPPSCWICPSVKPVRRVETRSPPPVWTLLSKRSPLRFSTATSRSLSASAISMTI